jgi:hypothetical protein
MVEPQLDNTDSEFNQLKIDRLIALVRDMPSGVPLAERTQVWHKLLDSDWLHGAGEPSYSLEQAMHAVLTSDPELGEELKNIKKNVVLKKLAIVERAVYGDSRIPSFRDGTISFNEGMDIYNLIRQDYPDVLSAYHSLVILSIRERNAEGTPSIAAHE